MKMTKLLLLLTREVILWFSNHLMAVLKAKAIFAKSDFTNKNDSTGLGLLCDGCGWYFHAKCTKKPISMQWSSFLYLCILVKILWLCIWQCTYQNEKKSGKCGLVVRACVLRMIKLYRGSEFQGTKVVAKHFKRSCNWSVQRPWG